MPSELQIEYEALRGDFAILPELGLSLIDLSGADALDWLQGQATNDLRGMAEGERRSFCLCQPTGQMLAVCDLWISHGRLLLATDSADAALRRAEEMVVLEDVSAKDLSSDYGLVSVQGPGSEQQLLELAGPNAIVLRNDRLGMPGWDIWSPEVGPMERLSSEVYEVARIEAGVPRRGVDYSERTLPPELGPVFEAKHVSYNKGCYTGQEVLMRIHSRGHTNRTWVGLLLEESVSAGDKVQDETGKDVGTVTSAAVSPHLGPIAAAILRNEAAGDGQIVEVRSVRGRVKALPLL